MIDAAPAGAPPLHIPLDVSVTQGAHDQILFDDPA